MEMKTIESLKIVAAISPEHFFSCFEDEMQRLPVRFLESSC